MFFSRSFFFFFFFFVVLFFFLFVLSLSLGYAFFLLLFFLFSSSLSLLSFPPLSLYVCTCCFHTLTHTRARIELRDSSSLCFWDFRTRFVMQKEKKCPSSFLLFIFFVVLQRLFTPKVAFCDLAAAKKQDFIGVGEQEGIACTKSIRRNFLRTFMKKVQGRSKKVGL